MIILFGLNLLLVSSLIPSGIVYGQNEINYSLEFKIHPEDSRTYLYKKIEINWFNSNLEPRKNTTLPFEFIRPESGFQFYSNDLELYFETIVVEEGDKHTITVNNLTTSLSLFNTEVTDINFKTTKNDLQPIDLFIQISKNISESLSNVNPLFLNFGSIIIPLPANLTGIDSWLADLIQYQVSSRIDYLKPEIKGNLLTIEGVDEAETPEQDVIVQELKYVINLSSGWIEEAYNKILVNDKVIFWVWKTTFFNDTVIEGLTDLFLLVTIIAIGSGAGIVSAIVVRRIKKS